MTDTFTLADETIAALANPKKGLVVRSPDLLRTPRLKRRASSLYQDVRQATRFVLDDGFVDFAMETSMRSSAQDLIDQFKLFRLPHENVWIEWNELIRQDTLERVSNEFGLETNIDRDNLTPRVGYLLNSGHYTGYEQDAYLATPIIDFNDNENIVVGPLSIEFAAMQNGSGYTMEHYRKFLEGIYSPATDEMVADFRNSEIQVASECLGAWWVQRNTISDIWSERHGATHSVLDRDKDAELYDLVTHTRLVQGPGIDFFVDTANQEWSRDAAQNMQNIGTEMTRGDSRFLITVMGLLNFDWIIKTPRESASRRYKFGKFRKGNAHIELAIDLPKWQGITILPKGFSSMNESSRRQHSVRGHWRKYQDGRRVWINAHLRGDPKLGVITKDYRLQHRSVH